MVFRLSLPTPRARVESAYKRGLGSCLASYSHMGGNSWEERAIVLRKEIENLMGFGGILFLG